MNAVNQSLEKILKARKIFLNPNTLIKNKNKIISDCRLSLKKEKKAVPMLSSKISPFPHNNLSKKIIIDAGGTNFRIMEGEYHLKKIRIKNLRKFPMPGSQKRITKNFFFNQIATYLLPYLKKNSFSVEIGFCFSYPFEMVLIKNDYEVFITHLSKDIKITGLKKTPLVKNLKQALKKETPSPLLQKRIAALKIVLLNDTVATLITGKFYVPSKKFSHFLGLVIGTGFNIAIEKGKEIINTEIGTYNQVTMNKIDSLIDQHFATPNLFLTEKKISGKYFDKIFFFYLKELAQENFFSPALNAYLKKITHINMLKIYQQRFLEKSFPLNQEKVTNPFDLNKISKLFKWLVSRSAFHAAFMTYVLINILELKKKQVNNVLISANGSMIEKCPFYSSLYKKNLNFFLIKEKKINYKLLFIDNSPTYGTFLAQYMLGKK